MGKFTGLLSQLTEETVEFEKSYEEDSKTPEFFGAFRTSSKSWNHPGKILYSISKEDFKIYNTLVSRLVKTIETPSEHGKFGGSIRKVQRYLEAQGFNVAGSHIKYGIGLKGSLEASTDVFFTRTKTYFFNKEALEVYEKTMKELESGHKEKVVSQKDFLVGLIGKSSISSIKRLSGTNYSTGTLDQYKILLNNRVSVTVQFISETEFKITKVMFVGGQSKSVELLKALSRFN